jgi:hypothetical protein
MKKTFIFITMIMVALSIFSFSDVYAKGRPVVVVEPVVYLEFEVNGSMVFELWAGQNINAGTVTLVFDNGSSIRPQFVKIHKLKDANILKNFSGTKIRIRPSIESIDLHSLLFLRKNVYEQVPEFTRNEYSLETFTKLK